MREKKKKIRCAIVVSLPFVTGCASNTIPIGSEYSAENTAQLRNFAELKADIKSVYSADSDGVLQFFAKEAAEAGVLKVRAMAPHEHPTSSNPMASLCGIAFTNRKLILIDTTRWECINLANLAHEISHIGANCLRHVDVFYDYNERMARRFVAAFPSIFDRPRWGDPVGSVRQRSAEYRSPGVNCY